MAIISESNEKKFKKYGNTQFRYAAVYVLITLIVLTFLNVYCAKTSQELFYKGKESSMVERCLMISADIGELEVINTTTVAGALEQNGTLNYTSLFVTDDSCTIIYDASNEESRAGQRADYPEIAEALTNMDVFSWTYHDGIMISSAAVPIVNYDTIVGCVYITEEDIEQGALMKSLLRNILWITLVLEFVVVLFSIAFSRAFARRLRRITASMQIIRSGDYSHKVIVGGRDELTFLGDEFNDLTDRLQSAELERRQFVSDASHELKTPLASIKLLSDSILHNDMDTETIHEFVEDIGAEADRLNRMSTKLLSLSRVESQIDSECEIVYIKPTLERVWKMLHMLAAEKNVTVTLDVQCDSPVLIFEDDLYEITFNLFENGIKYNSPNGKLTITILREDDTAIMRFTDTGVGIPKESLSQIFERFYRVDKARSRKSGGSGLGLSIVHSMVLRNGGTISVESTPGSGSVFTVTFPVFDVDESTQSDSASYGNEIKN